MLRNIGSRVVVAVASSVILGLLYSTGVLGR